MPRPPWKPVDRLRMDKLRRPPPKADPIKSPWQPACDRQRFRNHIPRRKHQMDILDAQTELHEEAVEESLEDARRRARASVISDCIRGRNESYVDNAKWCLLVWPLVRTRIPSEEVDKDSKEFFRPEWGNLVKFADQLPRGKNKAPSMMAIGMIENICTRPGGYESLLDKVNSTGALTNKTPPKEGEDDAEIDPEYAASKNKLDNFEVS